MRWDVIKMVPYWYSGQGFRNNLFFSGCTTSITGKEIHAEHDKLSFTYYAVLMFQAPGRNQ